MSAPTGQRHRSLSGLLAAACLLYSGSALNVGTWSPGATPGATAALQAPAALQVPTAVSSGSACVAGRDQPLQQAPRSARPWAAALQASLVAALAGSLLVSGSPAWAENELADLANSKSTSELVDPQCFADKCSLQTKACVNNPDCTKGLVCTAKCMGDAQCTVGCFARFGNPDLDKVLSCTIEDAECIKIALMKPGADGPLDAPLPPRPIIPVSKSSLQGKWYKVMGWNPMYDCFDCQSNTFDQPSAKEVANTIEADSMNVEVQYSMPRVRAGMKPETFSSVLHEQLEFDTTPGSRRTAHTEGKMFGLTFWENWYVLGENRPNEPQFKFVYYTGKTLQVRLATPTRRLASALALALALVLTPPPCHTAEPVRGRLRLRAPARAAARRDAAHLPAGARGGHGAAELLRHRQRLLQRAARGGRRDAAPALHAGGPGGRGPLDRRADEQRDALRLSEDADRRDRVHRGPGALGEGHLRQAEADEPDQGV